ncbi:hypothetical protein AJ80_09620 [Polytolypa hystricis UAMH7299]|uniref:Uncharacterized protein n=1 Tax=Polytolypa hystricis (strain UAMH7299) TaxID=1447883 RepID=A0A2B7WMA6_POLH7|nr:hypothetical protein AJ80_09620 [Polytolypa hystricis UAMH7299]
MKFSGGTKYFLYRTSRRPTNFTHSGRRTEKTQRRQTSSSPSSQKPSSSSKPEYPAANPPPPPPPTATNYAPAPASASALASAGASIPAIPETTLRLLRRKIKSGFLGQAADFYSRAQTKRPYWTQLLSTLFIYLCGDLSAQFLVPDNNSERGKVGDGEEESEEGHVGAGYDPLRTLRHLTVGAVAAIPGYKWFMFLHNNFNFTSKYLSILTKVVVSQACFTPIFNTYFFSMQSLLAGTSLHETWERLKKALPTSLINSVKLWPAITAFLFMYVDPQFRSIVAGGVAVGWQTYLSWLNQKAAREVGAAAAATGTASPVATKAASEVMDRKDARSEGTACTATTAVTSTLLQRS